MRPLYEIPRCTCGGKAHLTDAHVAVSHRATVACDACGRKVVRTMGTKASARAAALADWRREVGA